MLKKICINNGSLSLLTHCIEWVAISDPHRDATHPPFPRNNLHNSPHMEELLYSPKAWKRPKKPTSPHKPVALFASYCS